MRSSKLVAAFIVLGLLTVVFLLAAWPALSDFLAQDDCLDAGGAWRNSVCEGRRPGG